jgi:DNA mismatch repair protein MutS2
VSEIDSVNRHALEVLEFPRVLGHVADRAAGPLGREAVLGRSPAADIEVLCHELERVGATMKFLLERPEWSVPAAPDVRSALRHLAVDGAVLEPLELHGLGLLLAAGAELSREMESRGLQRYPHLSAIAELLHMDGDIQQVLHRSVDAEGSVLDTASRALEDLRRRLRRARSSIVGKLEAFIRGLPERFVVADASVSIREGRYVVPVRREGKGEVGGIVHDESATGATVFIEPPVAIALMNEVRELEKQEAREVHRILTELTRRLAADQVALTGSLGALVDFDSLHARARTAIQWEGEVPELLPAGAGTFRIVRGSHPLLLVTGEKVIPFDLDLSDDERCLVVSGPNTGGKSVFLKAVGLTALLGQSGCVPPVGAGTRLPVFSDVFADIGDEQSISESLSTFSAHLGNLREIVEEADGRSLVLIDEMGTGTDPAEGSALARAILETLVERGARAIVTSHLGQLKSLDTERSGIVNGSLQFDPDHMAPTYRFVKGRPGRSYGLAIARRSGFPKEILDRAEVHVPKGEADVEELLARLERKESEASELVESLAREEAEAERLRGELEERERELRLRERTAERRAREDAREFLLEAREEVEEAIREVRDARETDMEEVSRRARRRVEEAARRQARRTPSDPGAPLEPEELLVGQTVRVAGSGARGRVVEFRDDRVILDASGLRLEVPRVEVDPESVPAERRKDAEEADRGIAVGGWSGDFDDASHELDLRGFRVDEVDLELGRALDAALVTGLHEIRIIHGKGTGAVRSRVQEILRRDRRVKDFRLGLPGEGGAGVTVATVR